MTMAQRFAGFLRREATAAQGTVKAGALKNASSLLESLEEDNCQLRKLLEKASDVRLAERDRAFARRNGGIRQLRRELAEETRRVEEWLDSRQSDVH
ncbi:hypothetical protein [Ottowia sp.]|uniref:hypothetical protein n=1 Tax=Ottowia sp. TaxID=1898956 RepID=UPI0025ED6BBA|nr:hypothetical protein [Ottowia sp.]MBK6616390.1 hypothetical protein [Ottowia sp.]